MDFELIRKHLGQGLLLMTIVFSIQGPGGRVTDYRIPDLALLMKTHRLAPWPGSGAGESLGPGNRARMMLDRATR